MRENSNDRFADVAKKQLFAGETQAAFASAKAALRENPDATEALLVLATIACEHHNHAQTIQLVDLATAKSESGWGHALKARAFLGTNRIAEARRSARAAVEAPVADPEIADMVGVVLSRTGLHAEAPGYFKRAVDARPGNASYLYNLATALQFVGDLDGARQRYWELLALDPGNHRARLALVQLDRQTVEDNLLAELEPLFERPDLGADDALLLGHAIAKTCEDLGEWDRSFAWLEKAKARKATGSSYDHAEQEALFAAAAEAISVAFSEGGDDSEAPIFVAGLPRTGTTLVERILGSHSQVVSAGELSDFGMALKQLAQTPGRYVLDPPTLMASGNVDPGELGRRYLETARAVAGDVPRFIDKMPFNFFYAPAILAALPHARFICLRRDPADTTLSNFRQLFATEFSYYDYALRLEDTAGMVARFNRLADRYASELPPDRYRQVAYEDIVADQERTTRALLDFCGLAFEEQCLTPERNAQPVATASSVQVRKPVYSTSVARWKRYKKSGPRIASALTEHGLATSR